MRSNIGKMAKEINIKNPQELSHKLVVSWPTAKQLWDGDIRNTRLVTMVKVAKFFGCRIDDLLEANEPTAPLP